MAIRSNSKAAKAAIREYIREVLIERADEDSRFSNGDSLADACKAYVEYLDKIFRNDHFYKYSSARVRYDLDCGGAWEVGTWERAKMVGSWLQEDEDTIERYYEMGKADETWRNLIVREVMQLAGR